MSEMISVASGFQYSVNIGYDLNNNDKLENFIPTRSAIELLKDILLSTNTNSTDRARILIGAYGKGKSHIVLVILSLLMGKNPEVLKKLLPKIQEDEVLHQIVKNYYDSKQKILPVIISGSNTSLTQAFILALQRTLEENNLSDIMPETNYQAAINVLNRWENDYTEVYKTFENQIGIPILTFREKLENYDIDAYKKFEDIYPKLTAGSVFNPFSGFDVVELYESVVKEIKSRGYSGIYLVYDEFSKYLEANIKEASVSDTKMLQDFAEKCCRSGKDQMHIMLISHKEISNYIDILPKSKVDGWRGISERFKHVHLTKNFNQVYDIISTVIQKDTNLWSTYKKNYAYRFDNIIKNYKTHPIFSELYDGGVRNIVESCFPLHPVSTYILPRLSERVAQNERTLFTFLSADGQATLSSYLRGFNDQNFELLTPDLMYDYFEDLFKRDIYSTEQHQLYLLSARILSKLHNNQLASKLIKTLTLIYILGELDKLRPTDDELIKIYADDYGAEAVEDTLKNLISNEYVIYLQRSNGYLKLKESSGVNIAEEINKVVEKNIRRITVKDSLNRLNNENTIYPYRYNDEKEMTRFFDFRFIESTEITEQVDWNIKAEKELGDGMVYAVLPLENDNDLENRILETSKGYNRFVFVLPKMYTNIESTVRELDAAKILRESASGDEVLFNEYDAVCEDLQLVTNSFIAQYTHPENYDAIYIHNGEIINIHRKAELTSLLSNICDEEYYRTPVIINEALNKNEITSVADKSRRKILSALLQSNLDNNLGFSGNAQEVTIMRSILLNTGLLVNDENGPYAHINLNVQDECIKYVSYTITNFLNESINVELSFKTLYDRLMLPEYNIGLRKGLIPIFIAVVIHDIKNEIIISDGNEQIPLSTDLLLQINAAPEDYTVTRFLWDAEKEDYIKRLTQIFGEYTLESINNSDSYEYLANSMRKWYLALPKYTKEVKKLYNGDKIDRRYLAFIKLLKGHIGNQKLIFEHIPMLFDNEPRYNVEITNNVKEIKDFYDGLLNNLKKYLADQVKHMFILNKNAELINDMSLSSVIKDWCDSLNQSVFNQLFTDGTDKCLKLFKNITNDEDLFIDELARLATGLRIEDWNEAYIAKFSNNLASYKKTAETFDNHSQETKNNVDIEGNGNYQLTYIDENNNPITKSFEKVETSRRAKILMNQVQSDLEAMGQAINDQEKRQVLMEILMKLC